MKQEKRKTRSSVAAPERAKLGSWPPLPLITIPLPAAAVKEKQFPSCYWKVRKTACICMISCALQDGQNGKYGSKSTMNGAAVLPF